MGPFRGVSETSCAKACHLLVSESFLSKELSSLFLSQGAGCHLKRQLKSLTMAGLKSALAGLVSKSLTPQRKLSLIMFRYGLRGIRLEERTHEMGVQKRPSSKGNLNGKQWRFRAGRNGHLLPKHNLYSPTQAERALVYTHTHQQFHIQNVLRGHSYMFRGHIHACT